MLNVNVGVKVLFSYLTLFHTAACRDNNAHECSKFVCTCSPSYGATYLDAELLQRQSYTTTHQLSTYTTSHIPVAAGTLLYYITMPFSDFMWPVLPDNIESNWSHVVMRIFLVRVQKLSVIIFLFLFWMSGTLESNSSTPETSIMSFLSAMESRSLQAGPVSASFLTSFRPPSWPAGENTSVFQSSSYFIKK